MFSFQFLVKNSVTVRLRFLLLSISTIISSKALFYVSCLDCILEYFCEYHSYHLNNQ